MRAAERGQLSVVKVLLTAGANVNVSQGGESLAHEGRLQW